MVYETSECSEPVKIPVFRELEDLEAKRSELSEHTGLEWKSRESDNIWVTVCPRCFKAWEDHGHGQLDVIVNYMTYTDINGFFVSLHAMREEDYDDKRSGYLVANSRWEWWSQLQSPHKRILYGIEQLDDHESMRDAWEGAESVLEWWKDATYTMGSK